MWGPSLSGAPVGVCAEPRTGIRFGPHPFSKILLLLLLKQFLFEKTHMIDNLFLLLNK